MPADVVRRLLREPSFEGQTARCERRVELELQLRVDLDDDSS